MKKFFSIVFILIIVVFLASCTSSHGESLGGTPQDDSQVNSYDSISNSQSNDGSEISLEYPLMEPNQTLLREILNRVDNKTQYQKLITKEIDLETFTKPYYGNYNKPMVSDKMLITQVDDKLGIQCLRKTKDGALYSVHKVKNGGLLYIFYKSYSYDTIGDYTEVKNWYYVTKNLKYKDFSSINIGDDIESVIQIDPATTAFSALAEKFQDKSHGAFSYHYLKDGVLIISYNYTEDGLKIDHINFEKKFEIHEFIGVVYSHDTEYIGKILSQDYPKE